MTERVRRAFKVEAMFRQLNDRIAETARRFHVEPADTADFVCECADAACDDNVEATLEEYARVRRHRRRFLLRRGHEDFAVERVVAVEPHYAVVEKLGGPP